MSVSDFLRDLLDLILRRPLDVAVSVLATILALLIWNSLGKIKMAVVRPKLSFAECDIYDVGSTASVAKVDVFRILAAKCTVVNHSRFGRSFCDTAANCSISIRSSILDGILFWKPTRLVDDYTYSGNTRTWVDELYGKHFIKGARDYETATLKVGERKEFLVAVQLQGERQPQRGSRAYLFGNEKKELDPATEYEFEISLSYNRRTGLGDYSTGFRKFVLAFSDHRFAQIDC